MIPQSAKLFFKNYMTKAVIKNKKIFMDGLPIDISGITYM